MKRTAHHFIQLRVTDELEKQGYTHRTLGMSGRLQLAELDRIHTIGFRDSWDHCYRCCYTTVDKLNLTFNRLKMEVAVQISNRFERARMLAEAWDTAHASLACEDQPKRAAVRLAG